MGLPFVLAGQFVGRVDLVRVVAAAVQTPDVLVGHVGHHRFQFGILAEEMLPRIGATLGLVVLVFAVDRFFHALAQQSVLVLGQQRIPVGAPDDLDDTPAGTAEYAFQFLDDLAVAAHRTVQPLQVAVDHENQVVQPSRPAREMAPSDSGSSVSPSPMKHQTLRCDVSAMTPVVQILQEPRLVDRHDRVPGPWTPWATARNPASARGADKSSGRPSTSCRNLSSCSSVRRPSRKARA